MSADLITQDDLKGQMSSQEFFKSVISQIVKDFLRSGFEIDLSTVYNLDSLQINVETNLNEILKEHDLKQLFYAIDIPESLITQAMTSSNPVEALSSIIIRREAFKVFMRNNLRL